MAYSYLIKNITIVDGTGAPPFIGDVGIRDELIKYIGKTSRGSADDVIDGTGMYIIPGIIDLTNHSDTHWTLFTSPGQESMLSQGITTIVGGACGSSLAPLAGPTAIRAIQKWTDIREANINWQSESDFFEELSQHALGTNFGTFVGHGTLRRNISGDDSRPLEKHELESMKLMLQQALDDGALGLSINFGSSHAFKVPQDEFIELAKVVQTSGKLVSVHIRNEGRRLLSSIVEILNIARASGAHMHIAHFKAIGRKAWEDFPKALHMIKKAQEESIPITIDFFPYLRTGSLLYSLLPEWVIEGGKGRILELLQDTEKRDTVLSAIRDLTLHYDNIMIASAQHDPTSVGKTIATLAEETGLTPEEVFVELLIVNQLAVTIFSKTLRSTHLAELAKEPTSLFGSDGVGQSIPKHQRVLTHPRSFGSAVRFLRRAVVTHKLLSWEDAIAKMTLLPASRIGLDTTRGALRKGYFADMVVLRPDMLEDHATYKDPYQYSSGIEHVFVNGHLAFTKGAPTGDLGGKILRQG